VPTNYFDEPVAATYDAPDAPMWSAEVLDPTVDLLVELAGDGGAALELAVGTGRVALQLSERGLPVHGIELSEAMLRRLRAKPGAERVRTTQGDMTSARVDGRFTLVRDRRGGAAGQRHPGAEEGQQDGCGGGEQSAEVPPAREREPGHRYLDRGWHGVTVHRDIASTMIDASGPVNIGNEASG